VLFPIGPDVFDRVRFGCRAGEIFPETLVLLSDEIAGQLAAMSGESRSQVISSSPGNVAERGSKKFDYLGAVAAVFVQPEVEVLRRGSCPRPRESPS
jgi:hypothetical protein